MDERELQELELLEGLFENPGWAVLARRTQERIDAFKGGFPFNIKTVEELYFARGVLVTLTELLAHPDRVAAIRAQLDNPSGEQGEGEQN